jgi:uncharacterized membrane protein
VEVDSSSAGRGLRVASIDVLRGLVMVVMALDHVRDFASGAGFDPTDLEQTTPAYFFTRWITHFCAPTFFFLAGASAFLTGTRRTRGELSRWLVSRGLWLVVLEMTIIRWGWSFDPGAPLRLLVIWALGMSMIALAGIIYLPRWAIAAMSLVVIAGHNLFDGVKASPLIGPGLVSLHASTFDWVWAVLHVPYFPVLYPLIPWFAVMAAGYAFGPLLLGEPAARNRRLTLLGAGIALGFVVLRAINRYGDEAWGSPHAALSFLNVAKYPPSLLYLMMTLGPAIALLPGAERLAPTRIGGFLAIFGRVPFFYYILHLYVAHGLAVLVKLVVRGRVRGEGFDLWVVYALWIVVIAALTPLCRWFAGVKARRRDWWLAYL